MTNRLRAAAGGLLFVLALCTAVAAAQGPGGAPAPSPTLAADSLDIQPVRNGLYLITGGGANSLLRFSGNGLIVVNGKLPGHYRALKAQIRRAAKLTDQPVRVLFVTDARDLHNGTNAEFLAAGVPIVAQANASSRLPAYPGAGANAAPVIGFERDYTLRLGGVEVRLMHFGRGATDGDAVVLFPDMRVIAVGSLYTAAAPEPDPQGGGGLVNWVSVLEQVLRLDFDTVIPDQGPPLDRAALEAFKTRLEGMLPGTTTGLR